MALSRSEASSSQQVLEVGTGPSGKRIKVQAASGEEGSECRSLSWVLFFFPFFSLRKLFNLSVAVVQYWAFFFLQTHFSYFLISQPFDRCINALSISGWASVIASNTAPMFRSSERTFETSVPAVAVPVPAAEPATATAATVASAPSATVTLVEVSVVSVMSVVCVLRGLVFSKCNLYLKLKKKSNVICKNSSMRV